MAPVMRKWWNWNSRTAPPVPVVSCIIQVFEGTRGLSLQNTTTTILGHPVEMSLSKELLGRVLNGSGRPIDGLGEIYWEKKEDINGKPLNPVSRTYPRNYINTGISAND